MLSTVLCKISEFRLANKQIAVRISHYSVSSNMETLWNWDQISKNRIVGENVGFIFVEEAESYME
jgi:hypothetical protein